MTHYVKCKKCLHAKPYAKECKVCRIERQQKYFTTTKGILARAKATQALAARRKNARNITTTA